MERRSSLRRPIHHEALLRLESGAQWPCIIADYCAEGVFLKYSLAASKALEECRPAARRTLVIVFAGAKGETFELIGEPTHLMKGATGIRFVGKFDAAVRSLVLLSGSPTPNQAPKKQVEQIINEAIRCIQNFIEPLMQDFYPVLIKEIESAALKASTDQLANVIMDAGKNFQRRQSSIQQHFLQAIQDPIGLLKQDSIEGPDVIGRLAMIDKGEFEDWLTIRVLTTKAETTYRAQLLPLKMRLDAIGLSDRKHHQSPFGPSLLVNAFQSALSQLTVDSLVEKLIFKVFEKQIVPALEPLYEALNKILISHGVLPDLDLTKQILKASEPPKRKSPPELSDKVAATTGSEPTDEPSPRFVYGGHGQQVPLSAAQHSVTELAPPFAQQSFEQQSSFEQQAEPMTPGSAARDAADYQQQLDSAGKVAYDNVVGLVRSLRSTQHSTDGELHGVAAAPLENYSEAELNQGLANLQSAAMADVGDPEARQSLLERVQSKLQQSTAGDKGIHEDQQVTIDVVDRFFASLKNNPRLTRESKQNLYRLEIPVLKVLLKDEGFFDDRNNSVRAVMNRVAQLGLKGSRLNPASQKRVERLVQEIVSKFESDISIFEHVLHELDELVERQNQLYIKNVARVAAAAEGVHRVEQAKVAVARALNERIGHRAVPKAVLTLVDHGWQDLLQQIHLNHGEQSSEWRSHLAVLDTLIGYSDNPNAALNMHELLPMIQNGLKAVSGTSDPSPIVRDQLKSMIAKCPHGTQEMVRPEVRTVPESEEDLTRRNVAKSQELKHWIMRAKSIQAGTWVQFNKVQEETQYMRLVWVAKGYSKFVFVNHQGMKVVEWGLFKFATYLKDKMVLPDPDYEMPIVNQGLDDMVKDVYDKLAYEASHDRDTGLTNKTEFCRLVRLAMKEGEAGTACSLLYIRFDALVRRSGTQPTPAFARAVAEHLRAVGGEQAIIGRMSTHDFVLFSEGDELERVHVRCGELLLALCQQEPDAAKRKIVAIGESRAHLGFNNPESMISHAARPLNLDATVEPRKAVVRFADSLEQELPLLSEQVSTEVGEPVLGAIVESGRVEPEPTEVVQIDEVAESEDSTVTLGKLDLEIYGQKAMSLRSDIATEEQYELVLSVSGTGLSYVPADEKAAKALDYWWIKQLVRSRRQQDPAWEGIDFMRIQLSGYAFQDDVFKDYLLSVTESGDLEAGRIWFDLYDCGVIENIHAAADMMQHLIAKGYRFCLDHFGTSRAPYSLLKALPVSMIKIDESFVTSLNEAEADEATADSITEVAHYLGRAVLATSVDSAICLQRMKHLGVDYVQGATIANYELLCAVTGELV